MSALIYKICPEALWRKAERARRFDGAAIDLQDGYIHFSAADQVRETAARHFTGQEGLLLIAVDPGALGDDLRWEVSRGGQLFPHLYAPLPLSAVRSETRLQRDADGRFVFPADIP